MGRDTEAWQPTAELRFVHRFESVRGITYKTGKTLQQRWQSSDGQSEWRDVPMVTEVNVQP